MLIYKNSGGKRKPQKTNLKKGDTCVWLKEDGTVYFCRDGHRLLQHSEDDKFYFVPANEIQFGNLASVVAQAVCCNILPERNTEKLQEYRFV